MPSPGKWDWPKEQSISFSDEKEMLALGSVQQYSHLSTCPKDVAGESSIDIGRKQVRSRGIPLSPLSKYSVNLAETRLIVLNTISEEEA